MKLPNLKFTSTKVFEQMEIDQLIEQISKNFKTSSKKIYSPTKTTKNLKLSPEKLTLFEE